MSTRPIHSLFNVYANVLKHSVSGRVCFHCNHHKLFTRGPTNIIYHKKQGIIINLICAHTSNILMKGTSKSHVYKCRQILVLNVCTEAGKWEE